MSDFDENHKKILSAFITLKNKCTVLEKHTFNGLYILNRNGFSFLYANSFFSHMRDICDLSIIFMINEELSNATQRQRCGELLAELICDGHLCASVSVNGKNIPMSGEDFTYSLSDIEHLMSRRINQAVGSHMQDFSISAFSAFEKWLSTLYSCFSLELDQQYNNSRLAKAKKLLEAYTKAKDEECKDKIAGRVLKLHGAYISFPDKLNSILKMVASDAYPRDLSADKKIIEFLRIHRNTVHNGGVHLGKSTSIEYRGTDYSMTPGAPLYNDSWITSIELTGELVDIYANIIGSIKTELPPQAYCTFQEDATALLILQRVVSDYRHSDLGNNEQELSMIGFLERKFNLSNELATNFMIRLTSIIGKLSPDQEVDIFELLTSDLTS